MADQEPRRRNVRKEAGPAGGHLPEANACASAVEEILEKREYDANVTFQISEMVREAVNNAIKQLTGRGDSSRHVPIQGSPARSVEQLVEQQDRMNSDPAPTGEGPKWII